MTQSGSCSPTLLKGKSAGASGTSALTRRHLCIGFDFHLLPRPEHRGHLNEGASRTDLVEHFEMRFCDFFRAAKEGRPAAVTFDDAVRVQAVLEAAEQSAAAGGDWVEPASVA